MWKPSATTSWRRASSPSSASAGGQEEHPCEVNNSTTAGRPSSAIAAGADRTRASSKAPATVASTQHLVRNLTEPPKSSCSSAGFAPIIAVLGWPAGGNPASERKGLGEGMRIVRRFTTEGEEPYSSVPFRVATSEIRNPDGSVVFQRSEEH